jgi:N4-gp56 family major capsid protein
MNFCKKLSGLLLVVLGFCADVITVTAGTAGNAGSTAAELINYMSARLLEVAELNTILDQWGDKHPLPSNSSLTIQFVREEKLTPIPTTPTQLTQGIPPSAVGLTFNQFTATVEQYGSLVMLSDLAELTARHNIVERTIYILGLQAAEIYDQLLFNTLKNGLTTIYRPNNRSANTSLLASDLVGYNDLIELDAALQDQGGRPFESGEYIFVCAPQVYAGLLKDPDFKASVQFGAPERIWRGEVAVLGGLRVVRSNAPGFAYVSQATSGYTNKLFYSFALARYAYQITDLQNLRVYVVAPGGQADPLQQRRLIGWKFAMKSIVTQANWGQTVISSGLNATNN